LTADLARSWSTTPSCKDHTAGARRCYNATREQRAWGPPCRGTSEAWLASILQPCGLQREICLKQYFERISEVSRRIGSSDLCLCSHFCFVCLK